MKKNLQLAEYKNLILGAHLGSGVDRDVYVFYPDTSKVVKVQRGHNAHQNFLEWEAYNTLYGTKKEPWLAPCFNISECGYLLIQARVEPIPVDMLPSSLPEFMHEDLHHSNVGLYEGRVVMCDYGYLSCRLQDAPMRKKKVKW